MPHPPTAFAEAEQRLADALERIVAGTYRRCDGRLTASNLAFEAGVARATLYRHPAALGALDQAQSDAAARVWKRRSAISASDDAAGQVRARLDDMTRQAAGLLAAIEQLREEVGLPPAALTATDRDVDRDADRDADGEEADRDAA